MAENLLLEIGVEEIPHEILTVTLRQLKDKTIDILNKAGVEFGKINIYGTPRRLAVQILDLEDKTVEKVIEKKGPVAKVAYDEQGNPTRALEGFLKSNQAKMEDIEKKDINGNEYIFLKRKEGGEPMVKVLPCLMKEIISSLSFPKTMKWGKYEFSFVRPIRWIVAVYGTEVINFKIENISSGKQSVGHRLLENKKFNIENPQEYKNLLKEKEVFVDQVERKDIIRDKIEKTAVRLHATPVLDDKLLDTLINLTEYPDVAVGKFEKEFLQLPKEVLISEMVDHQKFVPLTDRNDDMINNFIIVTNTTPNDHIVRGNERVIRSRFSDGKFFFNEDRIHKLEDFIPRLENVSFAKGLGSLLDKIKRMDRIVELIAVQLKAHNVLDNAKRTAGLCKADLVTAMVNEFDELQGVMGYYYALHSGENVNVAVSIREHYYPRFSGDLLPSLMEGVLVSLADRIDNLFALYSVGKFVTGSKDPYALRRQTLGVIRILIEKKLHVDFAKLFDSVLPLYKDFMSIKQEDFKSEILGFITTRIKTVFKEYGFAYDEIDAGITVEVSDIYDTYLRIKSIHDVRQSEDFDNLAVAFKRVKNIIRDQERYEFKEEHLKEPAEKALYELYQQSESHFTDSIQSRDYQLTVSILKSFRNQVDRFFDEVMVMDKDEVLRNNRIALLGKIDDLFSVFIDFDKIVTE